MGGGAQTLPRAHACGGVACRVSVYCNTILFYGSRSRSRNHKTSPAVHRLIVDGNYLNNFPVSLVIIYYSSEQVWYAKLFSVPCAHMCIPCNKWITLEILEEGGGIALNVKINDVFWMSLEISRLFFSFNDSTFAPAEYVIETIEFQSRLLRDKIKICTSS